MTWLSVLLIRLMGTKRQFMIIGKYCHECPREKVGRGEKLQGEERLGKSSLDQV